MSVMQCFRWLIFWASRDLKNESAHAKLLPPIVDLSRHTGFEQRGLVEMGCSRHLLLRMGIVDVEQFVFIFEYQPQDEFWNPLTVADLILPRKRDQLRDVTLEVISCDYLAWRGWTIDDVISCGYTLDDMCSVYGA